MATTKKDIRDRLYAGKGKGYSHMLMVCDTFDYTDYPVFVTRGENIEEYIKKYQNAMEMSKIMEIYNYDMDLEYQLAEPRAMHKETVQNESKNDDIKLESIIKLPGFTSYSSGKIKLNFLICVPFELMADLPEDMNGYIDRSGKFFPAISITSTKNHYGNGTNITLEQFAEAFIHQHIKDPLLLEVYKRKISSTPDKKEADILHIADEFLIKEACFAKFDRYIDTSEYETTCERSCTPDEPSFEQLIILKQLFSLNHNSSTRIMEKDTGFSIQLAKKMKRGLYGNNRKS